MMAKRKMSLNELSEKVGLTLSNLSILTRKAKAIQFSTLKLIYELLNCQRGDILECARKKMKLEKGISGRIK
ncbi:helix-turn-helix domain-containing protein [Algoriphagus sp. D3-2-R+10]|uniref:helix-turn-helix domain-containing protein n=1 Tax=Algoriphagus aurantiacus TaxID=3103948 RepID=UPI002B3ECB59|nr:helix-turn-helix domain-containing protein [Algoriphagus sp. D3-2-R+10]MEB2778637.1 helix-turn-helix domain-containing protein [Algoriphagus sp. D3-2-R+10]